jgi:hypothetical protein
VRPFVRPPLEWCDELKSCGVVHRGRSKLGNVSGEQEIERLDPLAVRLATAEGRERVECLRLANRDLAHSGEPEPVGLLDLLLQSSAQLVFP